MRRSPLCSATVYSTCMFCHAPLGANEAIEHFPVGHHLAFDAAKGRLWAVCRSCERWNLSPIDERWEAIEECERLFRDSKLRVSTENIGLARLKEGTTLVRVGDPQRPEMAAWRYGDQFHRRRRKFYILTAGGFVAFGASLFSHFLFGGAAGFASAAYSWSTVWGMKRTVARVPAKGQLLKLSAVMADGIKLHPNETQGFAIELQHKFARGLGTDSRFRRALRLVPGFAAMHEAPSVMLHGEQATNAARILLPYINRAGAKPGHVSEAVGLLENSRGPEQLFGHTAFMNKGKAIGLLAPEVRLALEMSLHEEDERRALEGELAKLEDRWREAEEVAAISDDMFLPAGVDSMMKRLKGEPS
jgi:hypothetical protein